MANTIQQELDRLQSELQRCRTTLIRVYPWIEDYAVFSDEAERARTAMLEEIRVALARGLRDD